MKKNVSLPEKKSKVLMMISFIFAVLLFTSCSKEDVSPNSSSTNQSQGLPVTGSFQDHPSQPISGVPLMSGGTSTNLLQSIPEIPSDAMIFISHGACMGKCPVYTVMVKADGTVIFNGIRFVGTLGATEFSISEGMAHKLREKMITAGFLQLPDKFPFVGDMSETITALRMDNSGSGHFHLKVVEDWGVQVPQDLVNMRNMIEAALGIDKLINATTPSGVVDPFK